jgi:hypothetical protein
MALTGCMSAQKHAQSGNNSQQSTLSSDGGQIQFGPVANQTTEVGAMGVMMQQLHDKFGARPQVGKLFQIRDAQAVGAFFGLTPTKNGSNPITGMVIATKATSDHVEAAVIYDDASRFPKTMSPLMKKLTESWKPFEAAKNATSASGYIPPAPLHKITLPDNSASIGLPDGWQIVPKMSGMGTIVARGSNGESAEMGITFLASDTNNRAVQQTMAQLRMGRLQGTAYASATYYPYGGNLERTYIDMLQNVRKKAGLNPATYNFTKVSQVQQEGISHCINMMGTVDFNDQSGLRDTYVVYCVTPPAQFGSWLSVAYMTSLPKAVADKERSTMAAILQSFTQNQAVINQQARTIAAPAIAQIHAIGEAADAQAKAAHERNDIQNSSVYQHWDDIDRRSKAFSDSTLGYSVVLDKDQNTHSTQWNEDADLLVKKFPDRFEYVDRPDYWKGVDY